MLNLPLLVFYQNLFSNDRYSLILSRVNLEQYKLDRQIATSDSSEPLMPDVILDI